MIKCVMIQIVSLIYLMLLIGVVLSKKKVNILENSVYKILLVNTLFVLIFDIASNILIIYNEKLPFLCNIVSKISLISVIFWCLFLMIYVFSINNKKEFTSFKEYFKNSKLLFPIFIITFLVCLALFLFDPSYIYDVNKIIVYQSGTAVYYSFIICFIFVGISMFYIIFNPNNIPLQKRVPIYVFVFLSLLAITFQWIFSYILLLSSVMSFIVLFIYFTMENPDARIINELEEDNKHIEEASSAKTDFLSNMSHDIRTPMNAIIGFSESLLTEDIDPKAKDEVASIHEAANTLLMIINNILDVSRIESGKEEKQEKNYEINKTLTQLTSLVTTKLDVSKVKFNVNIDKNVPAVLYGDELKIYQILMNVLSNAVKYTEKGQIDFIISSENVGNDARLKFVVKDTGIGIKQSDYNRLFVKFSRIHNEENYKEIEGTGLGLVITKSLVELLGGTISFTSEYGVGTTFTIYIPQKIVENKSVDTTAVASSVGSSSISPTSLSFDGSLYDVLIVDDNNLNLKVAERILSDYKFHIETATSGDECLNLLKAGKKYDLIFLDHMMPIMDGIQTLQEIQKLQGVKIPPIVALTANALVGMKEMFISNGFDGYISKPINRTELQELLNNIFCVR